MAEVKKDVVGDSLKSLPNIITITRILISFTLFLVEPLSIEFMGIYFVCGLSDILDGFIARKTGNTSVLGAKLDSLADLVMVAIVIAILLPVIQLPTITYIFMIAITVIRIISVILVRMKFKCFGILHSYGNKATGFLLLLTPILLGVVDILVLTYVIGIFGSLSAVEELVIHIIEDDIDVDTKSIFHILKGDT